MRCMACGAEMILLKVIADETTPVPGFQRHAYMCSLYNAFSSTSTLNNENSRLCQHLLSQLHRCRIYVQPLRASWSPC
jgi:hypothetical protein